MVQHKLFEGVPRRAVIFVVLGVGSGVMALLQLVLSHWFYSFALVALVVGAMAHFFGGGDSFTDRPKRYSDRGIRVGGIAITSTGVALLAACLGLFKVGYSLYPEGRLVLSAVIMLLALLFGFLGLAMVYNGGTLAVTPRPKPQ